MVARGGLDGSEVRRTAPGRSLPAFVGGEDRAGNRGRSNAVEVFVSADALGWREETRVVTAAETRIMDCDLSGNDCGTYYSSPCGEVLASGVVPGGLSHRSALRTPDRGGPTSPLSRAFSTHLLEVPEAVHGIDRARVAFT